MNRVLLDTHILPLFGVGIEGLRKNFVRVLEDCEVYYSPVSIIEAKFVALQLLKSGVNVLEDYRVGLARVLSEERLKVTPFTTPEIEAIADELLLAGLKDYFDRMIYSTAVVLELTLVTEDRELIDLATGCAVRPPEVCSWRELCRSV